MLMREKLPKKLFPRQLFAQVGLTFVVLVALATLGTSAAIYLTVVNGMPAGGLPAALQNLPQKVIIWAVFFSAVAGVFLYKFIADTLLPIAQASREVMRQLSMGETSNEPMPIVHSDDIATMLDGFKELRHRLREANDRFSLVFSSFPDAVIMTDLETGKLINANRAFEVVFGLTVVDAIGKSEVDLGIWDDRQRFLAHLEEMRESGKAVDFETSIDLPLTGERRFIVTGCLIDLAGQRAIITVFKDITAMVMATQELSLANQVFLQAPVAIIITDRDSKIIRINPAFSSVTGYSDDEVLGNSPGMLASGRHDVSFYAAMWEQIHLTGAWHGEIWNQRKSGEIYPEMLTITALRNDLGQVCNYVGQFVDISARKQDQNLISRLANYDQLTDLPNKDLLQRYVEAAIQDASNITQTSMAMLCINLDRFKHINDTFGQAVGDEVIKRVAVAFAGCIRGGDVLARVSGDEFMIFLPKVANRHEIASVVARRCIAALAADMIVNESTIHISPSIGIALFPDHGSDFDSLAKAASMTMRRAKRTGKNRFVVYSADDTDDTSHRVLIEYDLRHAIERHELQVHYQPKIDVRTREIVGAEALLRWNHPTRGKISPEQFIPIAEETGLIRQIGQWVLREACRQNKEWRNTAFWNCPISVNVSNHQLRDADFLNIVTSALQQHSLPAKMLDIEITEGTLTGGGDTVAKLNSLRDIGVTLSIDDFGMGYSNLAYIKDLPIQTIKIDKSFILGLREHEANPEIIKAIIFMCQALRIKVIAEGVETEDHLRYLQSHDCDTAQGFLISRPLPATDFLEFVRQYSPPDPVSLAA